MPTVRSVVEALDTIAPPAFAFEWDRVGLQVGDPDATVRRGVVSLDRSLAAIDSAIELGAEVLVAHHPLLFEPISSLALPGAEPIHRFIRHGIAFIAAHTNWDAAPGGVNDALASVLGLGHVVPFGESAQVPVAKVVVTVPAGSAEAVIGAASAAGAGVIGAYSRCAFLQHGQGTFLPGAAARPHLGTPGTIETVDEVRIEMTSPEPLLTRVVEAVRRAHPYEEPVIDVYPLHPSEPAPIGRMGDLPAPMHGEALLDHVATCLGQRPHAWNLTGPVRRLAVVGGAADRMWRAARASGADAFLTGEVRQHVAVEAADEGFPLLAAGHYATEQPGCATLRDRLALAVPQVEWTLFEPVSGSAGRPAV